MKRTKTETVLVLGANGKSGSHAARAFDEAGWVVRRFDRHNDDLNDVAQGADLIFNGLNPPNYEGWATAIPEITRRVLAAAESSGATVMVPGNVYVFGPNPGTWNEKTPHRPQTRKGAIRAEMEATYRQAAERGIQTIILRAGDFVDDVESGTWLDLMVLKGLAAGRFAYPGRTDAKHSWAYLPDFARAAVALADRRESLAMFEDVPFAGFTLTGDELRALVEQRAGSLRPKSVPWTMMRLVSPLWRLGRELLEMRYLWEVEHSLDDAKIHALLPELHVTPAPAAFASIIDRLRGDTSPASASEMAPA